MTRAGAVLAFCLLLPLAATGADFRKAIFGKERATADVRHVANWVVHARDNQTEDDRKLPFVILDKKDARIYVFDRSGRLRGAAPALLGFAIGDTAVPGLGARELSNIEPRDRVTQAGRFVAELGVDSKGEEVLWLDYKDALAIHRVITSDARERRAQRLATPTSADNRISYGCINIPVKFYEEIVHPAFNGTKGIVYVLPETRPLHSVFASYDVDEATDQSPPQSPLRRVSAPKD